MPVTKGSYRNPRGEYNAWSKGRIRKPPIANYIPAYEQEISESKPEAGLEKKVEEG